MWPTITRWTATACCDQHVRLWDLRVPLMQRAILAEADQCVTLTTQGHTLAVGSDRGTVLFWDLRKGQELRQLDLTEEGRLRGAISCLAFSPCSDFLAVGSAVGEVLVFDLARQSFREYFLEADFAVSGLAWGGALHWSYPEPTLACSSHDGSWVCLSLASHGSKTPVEESVDELISDVCP